MKSNTSSKKKPFKLGSKARKALKAAQKSRASGGECIEEKHTKSFRYDEEKDEELKRLRALYASGAVGEKDEGNTECNNWRAIDVNSQFLVGSSEEGFVSLEVLSTEKEGEKDDAKTKKTKNETAKKSASKNDNNDDAFLPKNWFVKRDNVGITILERRESVTDILPFLFANVRARLLGVDITSDETYAKYALPDAANILSMIEMDALSSTRVRADMLEIVEILRGATNLGDIDAKDASYLASRSKESLAMLRDAVAMMDENRRQEAFKLVAKARKLAFQTSRESINVREDVTFPFEHELALAMPLVLPLLVAFTVRFAREFARYLARRRCFEELASSFHRGKVD